MDTFTTLWNRLQLRAPALGQFLASDLIRDCFQQLAERRQWSWLQKPACFFPPAYTITDLVTVVSNSYTVNSTSGGGQFTPAMVGKQIRVGGNQSTYPTYTIIAWISATRVLLDQPWTGPSLTGQQYIVFQCYFPVPADFQSFYSLVNPTVNMRLWTNISQAQLDLADAQRVVAGPSYGAAFYDYSYNYQGQINSTQAVFSTGATPVSTTTAGYSFPVDSIYSLRITTTGLPGGALAFAWKQNDDAYTAPVAVADNNPITLSNGVQVYFPQVSYTSGDTFVIVCQALTTPSVPRYELWPRPINAQYAYPYLYICKLPQLSDAAPTLPPFISQRGDVLLEMAMAAAAEFPGTATQKNPYYDLNAAERHRYKSERLIYELELKDDNTATKDLNYSGMEYAPTPWLDGSYLQSHAWPYASW